MDIVTLGPGLLTDYHSGRRLQEEIHAQVSAGEREATLIAVEHEPVYTVGRRAKSWERPSGDVAGPENTPVVPVDRGGKTTWHGPGQLTVYPIIRLRPPLDVIVYVRALEGAVIDFLAAYGLHGERVTDRSGVWLREPDRKICALGVRVARGTTLHGIGLNVCPDLHAFDLDRIIPCGIDDAGVTSLAAELASGEPGDAERPASELTPFGVWPALAEHLTEHLAPLSAD